VKWKHHNHDKCSYLNYAFKWKSNGKIFVCIRHGVNSNLELMVNSNSGNDYLQKKIDKFWNGIEVSYKTKLNPQINLPFNLEIFLPWQSYLEYKLLGVGIPSRYLLMVKSSREKNAIEMELINFMWNWQNGNDPMPGVCIDYSTVSC